MHRRFLLALLLLAGCRSSESIIRQQQDELVALRAENTRLQEELARLRSVPPTTPSGTDEGIGQTVEVLSTDLYFESGQATLNPEGIARLAQVAARLKGAFVNHIIRVEGYTDSNPIGERLRVLYPSNWELAAARAAAVVRHLQQAHQIDGSRFEVVGFGEYRPLASNAAAEGRQQNRRVRIAVLPR
jgi:chemotaxis protein MotB